MAPLNGWPARNARFIMSTASGSCSSIFSMRFVRSREILKKGSAAATAAANNARRMLCAKVQTTAPPMAPRATASNTSRCASTVRPACSIVSESSAMYGNSSSALSSGDSSRRYFSRSMDENELWPSSCSIWPSRAFSFLRVLLLSPKTGTIIACDSNTTAAKIIPMTIHIWSDMDTPALERFVAEELHRQVDCLRLQILVKRRHDTCRFDLADDDAVLNASAVEAKELGHRDDIAFHAVYFLDAHDAPPAVLVPGNLNHHVDGRRYLLAHNLRGKADPGHRHHALDAAQCIARRVRVHGRQRAVVAGVHRLQHVHSLWAADLADDDAIGPHTEAVAN